MKDSEIIQKKDLTQGTNKYYITDKKFSSQIKNSILNQFVNLIKNINLNSNSNLENFIVESLISRKKKYTKDLIDQKNDLNINNNRLEGFPINKQIINIEYPISLLPKNEKIAKESQNPLQLSIQKINILSRELKKEKKEKVIIDYPKVLEKNRKKINAQRLKEIPLHEKSDNFEEPILLNEKKPELSRSANLKLRKALERSSSNQPAGDKLDLQKKTNNENIFLFQNHKKNGSEDSKCSRKSICNHQETVPSEKNELLPVIEETKKLKIIQRKVTKLPLKKKEFIEETPKPKPRPIPSFIPLDNSLTVQ